MKQSKLKSMIKGSQISFNFEPVSDDIHLVQKIKNSGCNKSYDLLAQKHDHIYYKLFHKYIGALLNKGYSYEELIKDKDYILFQAIISFDESKNVKVSSWIWNYTRYYFLNLINNNKNFLPVIDNITHDTHNAPKDYTVDYVLYILNHLKDQRIKGIIKMRYWGDKKQTPWSDIAKKYKLSNQTVINLFNEGIKFVRNKLTSNQIFDKV